jgi:Flp pilus assembly protein TadG
VAVALPVLIILAAAGMAAVGVIGAQLRCIDSARAVARAVVRGEPVARARELGSTAAPAGARIAITFQGGQVVVTVSAEIRSAVTVVPTMSVAARAVGELEPGVAGGA